MNLLTTLLHLSWISSIHTLQPNGCEDGWHAVDQVCWGFFDHQATYTRAKSECGHYSSQLASIWTQAEWNFVMARSWRFFGDTTAPPIDNTDTGTTSGPLSATTGTPDNVTEAPTPLEPSGSTPAFGLWVGYQRGYSEKFGYNRWKAVDSSSSIQSLVWRSAFDATLNITDPCVAAGLDMDRMYSAAFYCNTDLHGYICKKARPAGFAVGRTDDEGTRAIARGNGVSEPTGLLTTGTMFQVQDISLYLSTATRLAVADHIFGDNQIGLCADRCIAMPLCVYFQTECSTYYNVCDGLACYFYTIP